MRGADREDVLLLIYGPNTTEYVLSGCSYEYAFGHISLLMLLFSNVLLKAVHAAKDMMTIVCCRC